MRACVLIVILFSGSEAMAVLPPRIARQRKQRLYATARAMQKTAPEVLVIKVERVRVKSSYASRRYHSGSTRKSHRSRRILKGQELRVDARIIRVVRSKRRLRRGQRVRFTYKLRYQYQPGPRIYNPLGLTQGDRARVYLRHRPKTPAKRGRYHLAASVLSVTNVKSPKRR